MSSAIERPPVEGFAQRQAPRFETTHHPGARQFRAEGETWSVYEDLSCYVGPSLIFESERIVRRVRIYPTNWEHLSDEELTALSWSR